jgi:predicted glycoside hydrolase/deacetylase ChbG (UPF0249 family)
MLENSIESRLSLYGKSVKQLIVNADDYGYTPGVSAGIRHAHRDGVVTSTSVMMPMPHARAALDALDAETPSLGVGVHLTLTEGVPFRLKAFPPRENLKTALAEISAVALIDEWRAQIDAFLSTGIALTHLDSHHHAAYRHENALTILLGLARQYRVPVRNPYPLNAMNAGLFAASGVRHPVHFSNVFHGSVPTAAVFSEALGALVEGITEFMVHPGLVDDQLRRLCPNFAEPRAQELSALTDACLREVVKRFGIELVNFAVFGATPAIS